MGLLDVFNTEEGQQALGLLAAAGPRFDGAGFGQRLQEGLGSAQKWKQQQQEAEFRKQQILMQQAQMANYASEIRKRDYDAQLAATKRAALSGAYQPTQTQGSMSIPQTGGMDMFSQGAKVEQPSTQGQPALNVQALLKAGYTPKEIQEIDALRHVGQDKVARVVSGTDQQGRPVNFQMDDFGKQVGAPTQEWKAPIEVGQGNSKSLIDPVTLQPRASFPVFQSPDSVASIASARTNHNETLKQQLTIAGLNQDGTASSGIQSTVDLIGSGKMAPFTGFALSRPRNQAIMEQVATQYPDFDATTYAGKVKAARDFTSGPQGNALRSFAVAGSHLEQLSGLVDALGHRDLNGINAISNIIAKQTGSVAPTNFDAAKDVVAKEIIKAIVGSAGGVEERTHLSKQMDQANSPAQLKGVIEQYRGLMKAQAEALLQQRRAAGLPDSTLPDYGSHSGSGPTMRYNPATGKVEMVN